MSMLVCVHPRTSHSHTYMCAHIHLHLNIHLQYSLGKRNKISAASHFALGATCVFSQVSARFGEFVHLFYASKEHPAPLRNVVTLFSLRSKQEGSQEAGEVKEGSKIWACLPLRAAIQVRLQRALRTCLGFYPAIVHFSTAFAHCGASGEFQQLEYT